MKNFNPLFLIGCARSGTTALAKIFNMASNADIYIEEPPKLCIESRDYYKGILSEQSLKEILLSSKGKRINELKKLNKIYGDKSPNYLPLIPIMEKIWVPRYIFIIRDGRDVVRSMMDWHEISNGNFFGMAEDEVNSHVLSPEEDWWDYSRIRPDEQEKIELNWFNMTRFEKCAWHWNKFNELLLENYRNISETRSFLININNITPGLVNEIFEKTGLERFDNNKYNEMINSKLNSKRENTELKNKFPVWKNWNNKDRDSFFKYAESMMKKLNYI